jgi:hypothetical protein
MAVYAPMTELEAVNLMLDTIGEQPVSLIPTSGISEAVLAYNSLHRTSRKVQGRGLHCNTEYNYILTADIDGKFNYPTDALFIDATDSTVDVARRQNVLYDLTNHTDVFTTTTLSVTLIKFLPFEDLPEHVREYITIKASRNFQKHVLGSWELHKMTAEDETEATANFMSIEYDADDTTFLSSPGVFDVINRRI